MITYLNFEPVRHMSPKCLDEVWVGLSCVEFESISYDIFLGEQFIRIT